MDSVHLRRVMERKANASRDVSQQCRSEKSKVDSICTRSALRDLSESYLTSAASAYTLLSDSLPHTGGKTV